MNELESLLRQFLPEVTIATTLDGKIAQWPDTAEHLFGYNHDEVTGRFLHKLLVPSGEGKHEQTLLQTTLANGYADRNSLWRYKKGHTIKVHVSNRLARDSDTPGACTVSTPSCPSPPSVDILIFKSVRVDDPRARLLAVFDILAMWIQASTIEDLTNGDGLSRRLLANADMSGTDSVIHELAMAAGLDNSTEFVHIWQILMNGSIIAARQGNPVSAAEIMRAAHVVLEEWGIKKGIQ